MCLFHNWTTLHQQQRNYQQCQQQQQQQQHKQPQYTPKKSRKRFSTVSGTTAGMEPHSTLNEMNMLSQVNMSGLRAATDENREKSRRFLWVFLLTVCFAVMVVSNIEKHPIHKIIKHWNLGGPVIKPKRAMYLASDLPSLACSCLV